MYTIRKLPLSIWLRFPYIEMVEKYLTSCKVWPAYYTYPQNCFCFAPGLFGQVIVVDAKSRKIPARDQPE